MVVFVEVKKEDLRKLKGSTTEKPKTIYEETRLKYKEVILILYTSGKLLLQGKKEEVDNVSKELGKLKIGCKEKEIKFKTESGIIIGSDESLKGDTFGGIVVAAVKADDNIREKLREIGVADSKTLDDKEIVRLAAMVRKIAPCEVRSILPEEYNVYDKNVTSLLDKLHAECAKFLAPGKHIVDKYPGCTVGDVKEEKAESKYVEVAAASILARDAALAQLNSLSMMAGFRIPKGSTHVHLALLEAKQRGLDLSKFVKMDFWNVKQFLKDK